MMNADGTLTLLTLYSSLLIAGLAASLHCIGMCGPILLGFAEVFDRATLTIDGRSVTDDRTPPQRRSWLWDFGCYHAGRIWTYALLGFCAGLLGQGIRDRGAYLGLQFPLAIAGCAAVIAGGVLLLGVLPTGKIGTWLAGCGTGALTKKTWLAKLAHQRGWVARLLLGVVMGLLPCGMVYAVLLVVVAMPTPLHSAVGMVMFGFGTLPSLTGVLLAHRVVPRRFRAQGSRWVAVVIIAAGSWMMARTWLALPASHQDHPFPACHSGGPGTDTLVVHTPPPVAPQHRDPSAAVPTQPPG